MAFALTEELTEVRIYDERSGSTQRLYARSPLPKEELAFQRERVVQKAGKTTTKVYQTRLKYGCLVLERPQSAATEQDDGYGFKDADGAWVPLSVDLETVPVDRAAVEAEFKNAYGADWARWIGRLEPWKLLLLAKAPQHIERVASVVFEGAADYKQGQADADAESEEETLGN